MKMVALKEIRYSGKQILAGGSFEARERDVKVLRAIKHARLPEDGDQAEEQHDDDESKSSPPKRTYKRRDMKAE